MRLVLFLPSLSNWLRRPVGVHPPNDNPNNRHVPETGGSDIYFMGRTCRPLAKLAFVVAYLIGSSCQDWVCACPFQCLGLTDHRDGPWLPMPLAGRCFTKHRIWRWEWGRASWLSRKVNTEEALPGHRSPSPPSLGKVRSCLYDSEGCGGMCGHLLHPCTYKYHTMIVYCFF